MKFKVQMLGRSIGPLGEAVPAMFTSRKSGRHFYKVNAWTNGGFYVCCAARPYDLERAKFIAAFLNFVHR